MRAIPSEFQSEYEAEIGSLLHRRFAIWVIVWAIVQALWIIGYPIETILCLLFIGVGGWIGSHRSVRLNDRLRGAFWMLIATTGIELAFGALRIQGATLTGAFFWSGTTFLLASLFLPMTIGQAARPAAIMMIMWVVCGIWTNALRPDWMMPASILFATLMYWPGLVIAAFRSSRFGSQFASRMLRRHQVEFDREVFDAAKLHKALFPEERLSGPVRFRYIDLPRAGIGGDFLHAAFDSADRLNLVLLDVSGDGISAALTVHRLQGELERVMAESSNESVRPDEALETLNRYVRLTLAPHGIYAFALFIRIAEDGRLEWCGAGHTPAFVRRTDGSTDRLESTTWPLGASDERDPLQCLMTTTLHAGDVLIAHTDGACEERNAQNERLGYSGVDRMIREADDPDDPFDWPEHFVQMLEDFRTTDETPSDVRREDLLIMCAQTAKSKRTSDPTNHPNVECAELGATDRPMTSNHREGEAVLQLP